MSRDRHSRPIAAARVGQALADRVERVGGVAVGGARAGADLARTFGATWRGVFRSQRPPGEVANQMYVIGNKSLLFVCVTLGFIGMVMVFQSCLQLNRITGDLSQVGPEFLKLLIQDFGPSITALMLATRVGAGIAAEVGSMVVTEQVDALRMSGVTPIDYLITPRFIASLVMTMVLTVFGVLVAYAAGGLTAWSSFDLNPRTFFDPSRVRAFDLGLGMVKALSLRHGHPGHLGLVRPAGPGQLRGRRRRHHRGGDRQLARGHRPQLHHLGHRPDLAVTGALMGNRGIEFRDIWKAFGDKPVLRGMTLSIDDGEVMFIIGTSGVGKSVTIKLLVGLLRADRGEIHARRPAGRHPRASRRSSRSASASAWCSRTPPCSTP